MSITSPLLTDFYQLTMAYGYWKLGMAEREAVFQLFFRKQPFQGQYAVACGLAGVIEYLEAYHFNEAELEYLCSVTSPSGRPLFEKEFIEYLRALRFSCEVLAVSEGELVFRQEPLVRVRGPLLQCQLIETPLVNRINFATLIATKAARICVAAQGDPVIEFGLRRAQGPDGGLTASRAAYVGGCDAVANALAGFEFKLPVKGTQAHSWIMSFPTELEAFSNFASVMPDNTILLVDTYDTLHGVEHAIQVGHQLRAQGQDLLAIRLDSGDLNTLSCESRRLLDQAGFNSTKIMASGDLDEYLIAELKRKGARIDIWGVGTRLTTAFDQPSLDCAYKLSAIRDESGKWQYKIKRSNQREKTTNPGIPQIRRYYQQQQLLADVIYDQHLGLAERPPVESHVDQDLLIPIFIDGQRVYQQPPIDEIRSFCQQRVFQFAHFEGEYLVTLDSHLQRIQEDLYDAALEHE